MVRIMRVRSIEREGNRLAEIKLQVIRQQELAASRERQGHREKARQARDKLIALVFKMECLKEQLHPA